MAGSEDPPPAERGRREFPGEVSLIGDIVPTIGAGEKKREDWIFRHFRLVIEKQVAY